MEGRVVAPREPCPALCPSTQNTRPEAAHPPPPSPCKGGQHAVPVGLAQGSPAPVDLSLFAGHSRWVQRWESGSESQGCPELCCSAIHVPSTKAPSSRRCGSSAASPQEGPAPERAGREEIAWRRGSGEQSGQDVQARVGVRGAGQAARPGVPASSGRSRWKR